MGGTVTPSGAVDAGVRAPALLGSDDLPVSRLEWAVRAAGRRVPMASCLTQALALQFLLGRSGHFSEVLIGVRKDVEADFSPTPG